MKGSRRRWIRQLLRSLPRRRHLRGSRLHGLLGEKLFDRELWALTGHSLAGGLAVGLFIGLTPTMGVQTILATLAAFFLRVNIPAALLATLVTNPFSAPVIYAMEYRFGVWLLGPPAPQELEGYTGMLRNFVGYARPIWAGGLIAASLSAALAYGLVTAASTIMRPKQRAEAPPDRVKSNQRR